MALSEEERTIKIKYDKLPMELLWKIMVLWKYTDQVVLSTEIDSIEIANAIIRILEGSHFEETKREDKIIRVTRRQKDGAIIKTDLKVKLITIEKKELL